MTKADVNLSIALNAINDIFVGADGNLAFVSGVDAVKQDCACALKAQRGEMLFNTDEGMPTFDDVWLSHNFIKWEAVGRATLAGINGVVRVISFSTSVAGDVFKYTAVIETIYSSQLATVSGTLGN